LDLKWIVGWGSNGEGRIGRSGGGNGLPVASFYGGAWPDLAEIGRLDLD